MPDTLWYEANDLFLFVNPKSGGNVGESFLKAPSPLEVCLTACKAIRRLHTYSLREGISGSKPGFIHLREVVSAGQKARVVVGGGDGTIMWVVTEVEKHGINPREQIAIAMIPLGTGNDFSQSLGWGSANPNGEALARNDFEALKHMVEAWCKATPSYMDVWQVSIKVDEQTGTIYQREEPMLDIHGEEVTELETCMLLYCGIAKDAELAYRVEMHRTKSQCCNKLVYGWQGLCISMHFFCCVGQRVQRVIRGLYNGLSNKASAIFETGIKTSGPRLYSNPEMILCLNINSFAGGEAKDLWANSWRLGTSQPLEDDEDDLLDVEQNPGDHKLEVLTLSRLLRVALPTNRLLAGRRVFQGAPLHFEFKQRKYRDLNTFCQVDGESYRLQNPLSLTIQHRQQICVLHSVGSNQNTWCFCNLHPGETISSDGEE
eukprot:TRINITY_DN94846_c0_g1_i1.p1 TRINITY_DN94846_c0_g1~~TRINITY_DN94846_c0_g1_i1.p1  ORF type:complete len:431 (-),score=68.85 TRINITY_DN94846_c0_g1_i1:202-1494(-)